MPNLITIQVGKAGNTIAEKFWSKLCNAHSVGKTGVVYKFDSRHLTYMDALMNGDKAGRKFTMRNIPIDLDPDSVRPYATGEMAGICRRDRVVNGSAGTGNNFAVGAGKPGKALLPRIMDNIRLEAEDCDALQGFNIMHGITGGTGSGTGSLVIDHLVNEYPKDIVTTITVFPSTHESEIVVAPYNAMLAFPYLNNTHQTIVIHNERLTYICKERMGLEEVTIDSMNSIICHTLLELTVPLRHPGSLNTSFRKLYTNLVPSTKLHMLTATYAPARYASKDPEQVTVSQLFTELFKGSNALGAVDMKNGKRIAAAAVCRGRVSPLSADVTKSDPCGDNLNLLHRAVYPSISEEDKRIATCLINTSGINQCLEGLQEKFDDLYSENAFLHWFTNHGMEKSDFEEASEVLKDIVHSYAHV